MRLGGSCLECRYVAIVITTRILLSYSSEVVLSKEKFSIKLGR